MRILYVSDLHGRMAHYDLLAAQVTQTHPELLILGGDLLPRAGSPQNTLQAQIRFFQNEITTWLHNLPCPVVAITGNDDLLYAAQTGSALLEDDSFRWLDHSKTTIFKDVCLAGYPFVPPTPFSPKDVDKFDHPGDDVRVNPGHPFITTNGKIEAIDYPAYLKDRSSIEEDLASVEADDPLIFVSHCPPYETDLDRLSDGKRTPVGSKAIREFIEYRQPLLSLHGHIHESPQVTGTFWTRLGKTISINAGQDMSFISTVQIDIGEEKIILKHNRLGTVEINL